MIPNAIACDSVVQPAASRSKLKKSATTRIAHWAEAPKSFLLSEFSGAQYLSGEQTPTCSRTSVFKLKKPPSQPGRSFHPKSICEICEICGSKRQPQNRIALSGNLAPKAQAFLDRRKLRFPLFEGTDATPSRQS
jgi:hypothetical protein